MSKDLTFARKVPPETISFSTDIWSAFKPSVKYPLEALIIVKPLLTPLTSKPLSLRVKVPTWVLVLGLTNSIVVSNVLTWPIDAVRK